MPSSSRCATTVVDGDVDGLLDDERPVGGSSDVLALVLVLAFAAPADARLPRDVCALDRIEAQMDALDYPSAAAALSVCLASPELTGARRVRAHLLAGIARRVIGDDTEARLHFLAALVDDPDATLPPRPEARSPKVLGFFDLIRTERRAAGASALAEATSTAGSAPSLAARPVLLGVGVALVVLSAGAVAYGEWSAGNLEQTLDERQLGQTIGRAGIAGVILAGGGTAALALATMGDP